MIYDLFSKYPRTVEHLVKHNSLTYNQGAVGKAKECLKMQQEGRMVESTVQTITQKADIISCGTLAEITHFQAERTRDFKSVMTTYLRGQIEFYGEVMFAFNQIIFSYLLKLNNSLVDNREVLES